MHTCFTQKAKNYVTVSYIKPKQILTRHIDDHGKTKKTLLKSVKAICISVLYGRSKKYVKEIIYTQSRREAVKLR